MVKTNNADQFGTSDGSRSVDGSDREFLGPGDKAELGKRQSLLTPTVFESAEPAECGPALLSASGSSPTHRLRVIAA